MKNPDNVYSFDVPIAATAYVRASSPKEARELLGEWIGRLRELMVRDVDGDVSEMSYDNVDLPEVSLSPMMTIWPPPKDTVVDHVYDPEEEDE